MSEHPAFDAVAEIIRRVLARDVALSSTTPAADVRGWDSHATVEIIFEIEEHYGFQLSAEEMEQVDGVASLLRLIETRLPAGATS